jgi:hypothetical protein
MKVAKSQGFELLAEAGEKVPFDRERFKRLVHYVIWAAEKYDGLGATKLFNTAPHNGFNPASISRRRPSRKGGSDSLRPSDSTGSSAAKPGPSVAISNSTPLGSRK